MNVRPALVSRVGRKRRRTNKYDETLKMESGSNRRPSYFRRYREERKQLAIMENSYSQSYSSEEYRANRYLYYVVLPRIYVHLKVYDQDFDRMKFLERNLHYQLISYLFVRDEKHKVPDGSQGCALKPRTKAPNRVLRGWFDTDVMDRRRQSQRSSSEPILF